MTIHPRRTGNRRHARCYPIYGGEVNARNGVEPTTLAPANGDPLTYAGA